MKTRKEIEEESRMQHILGVAENLFAQKGLQHTSVSDIAQAAEFGVGTLYKYFKDKNTLIASLIQQRLDAHFSALEAALDTTGTPPEIIDRFIEAYLQSVGAHMTFFKIYFMHFQPASVEEQQKFGLGPIEHRKMELFGRVDDIYKRGIDQGHFVNVGDVEYLTAATWGILMSFYFMAEHKFDGAVDVTEMKNVLHKLLFEKVKLSA